MSGTRPVRKQVLPDEVVDGEAKGWTSKTKRDALGWCQSNQAPHLKCSLSIQPGWNFSIRSWDIQNILDALLVS